MLCVVLSGARGDRRDEYDGGQWGGGVLVRGGRGESRKCTMHRRSSVDWDDTRLQAASCVLSSRRGRRRVSSIEWSSRGREGAIKRQSDR